MVSNDTICALATAPGEAAIAVIRLSGEDAFTITDKIFFSKKAKKIAEQKPNTIHFGEIRDKKKLLDEVLVSVFKAPHSYTGENSVEISCHGSRYIQQSILNLLINNGARTANPGEFTQRAFLNGKMDLSQAEAVADLIASSSAASHKVAMRQMRGGFSYDLEKLSAMLLKFISLIELELDFSEEDVEFADRKELIQLIHLIKIKVGNLTKSFELGNAIKNGIPVAIIGEPNVGKSTLLNTLLNEDKAIVSDIPGTTRDAIEDVISIKGLLFRFIDTAGLRDTTDKVENLGIERTNHVIDKAEIVILLVTANDTGTFWSEMVQKVLSKNKKLIVAINKIDIYPFYGDPGIFGNEFETVLISAKEKNIADLESALLSAAGIVSIYDAIGTIITNARHYELLKKAKNYVELVMQNIDLNVPTEFLVQDIREILKCIGQITGQEFSPDEVLGNIFKNFCIGK